MNEQPMPTPRNEMTDWRGIKVLACGLVLSYIPLFVSIRIDPGVPIGTDPPWYFIIQQFYEGVGAWIGIVLGVSVAAVMWKKYPYYSYTTLWMVLLWQSRNAALGLYIWLRCPNLFDRAQAVSPWKTSQEFIFDPMQTWGGLLIMIAVVAITMLPMALKKRPPKPHIRPTTTN